MLYSFTNILFYLANISLLSGGGGEGQVWIFLGEWAGKGEGGEARNTNQQLQ